MLYKCGRRYEDAVRVCVSQLLCRALIIRWCILIMLFYFMQIVHLQLSHTIITGHKTQLLGIDHQITTTIKRTQQRTSEHTKKSVLARTHPLPTLSGLPPSVMAMVSVRAWSATTRYAMSTPSLSSFPTLPVYVRQPVAYETQVYYLS